MQKKEAQQRQRQGFQFINGKDVAYHVEGVEEALRVLANATSAIAKKCGQPEDENRKSEFPGSYEFECNRTLREIPDINAKYVEIDQ